VRIEVGGNVLECDVDATVAAFAAYTPKLPWTCQCSGCRNYRVARDLIYTAPVLEFFAQFGIDTMKPAEIYEGGLVGDTFNCGCWFQFAGTMATPPQEPVQTANMRVRKIITERAVYISEALQVDFTDTVLGLVPPSFKGRPLVQLECLFKIPWLLAEPWSP
jgi:hypothetical protein